MPPSSPTEKKEGGEAKKVERTKDLDIKKVEIPRSVGAQQGGQMVGGEELVWRKKKKTNKVHEKKYRKVTGKNRVDRVFHFHRGEKSQ